VISESHPVRISVGVEAFVAAEDVAFELHSGVRLDELAAVPAGLGLAVGDAVAFTMDPFREPRDRW